MKLTKRLAASTLSKLRENSVPAADQRLKSAKKRANDRPRSHGNSPDYSQRLLRSPSFDGKRGRCHCGVDRVIEDWRKVTGQFILSSAERPNSPAGAAATTGCRAKQECGPGRSATDCSAKPSFDQIKGPDTFDFPASFVCDC